MRTLYLWAPAVIMGLGAAVVQGLVAPQLDMMLERPLAEVIPETIGPYEGVDQEISAAEAEVAGFDDYVLRTYTPIEAATSVEPAPPVDSAASVDSATPVDSTAEAWISLYVGYYRSQTQGRTIHSPKNCLPGGGWEPLQSGTVEVTSADGGRYPVNRYILQRDGEQALVLYWYQGRGRVRSNEYLVKLDLLLDAAIRRRTDEALVRIVIPIEESEEAALATATGLAADVIPIVDRALPN